MQLPSTVVRNLRRHLKSVSPELHEEVALRQRGAQRRGGGAPSGATQPKTHAQRQAYVLKAQQAESAAREELRQLQAKVDQSSRSHTDELGESQRAREELRGDAAAYQPTSNGGGARVPRSRGRGRGGRGRGRSRVQH